MGSVPVSALQYETDVKIGDRLVYAYHSWNFSVNAWNPTIYTTYDITSIGDCGDYTYIYADRWESSNLSNLTEGVKVPNAVVGLLKDKPILQSNLLSHGIKVGDYAQYFFNESMNWKGKNETFEVFAINNGYGITTNLRNDTEMVYTKKYLYSTSGILLRLEDHGFNDFSQKWLLANLSTAMGVDEPSTFGSRFGNIYTDYEADTIDAFANLGFIALISILGVGIFHRKQISIRSKF